MTKSRPRAGRPLSCFLLFAAALFVVSPAEASRTTGARSSLAAISATPHAPSSLELSSPAALELVQPIDPVETSPRFGFAEELGLLDVEARPCGFELFGGVGTNQCALTYARNNPLKYVDPDGRDDELAADFMMREQVRDMGGDAAVARMDQQRAVITATIAGTAAVGLAAAEWGPAALYAGQQALTWLGDKFSPAVQGRYGQVAQSELARAASAEGPAVQVVTRLTSAPEAGRALSISTGEGATALSNAARASGNLYQAQIPKAFLAVLEKNGLAFSQRTMMNGKVGMEYRILPQATEYIVKLFRQVPGDGAGGTK